MWRGILLLTRGALQVTVENDTRFPAQGGEAALRTWRRQPGSPGFTGPHPLDPRPSGYGEQDGRHAHTELPAPSLKGDLNGHWAVTVKANWRIIFRFEEGDAFDVDLVDYH